MELSTFNIKKIPYIFSKGSFSYIFSKERIYYISRNGTLQFSVQALKIKELHSGKICYTSGNKNTEKNYLKVKQSFLKSKLFFCFGKRNHPPPPPPPPTKKKIIFQEMELIYQERYIQTHLGLWYIQNPSIFRTKSFFRTLTYLELEAYS